MNKFSKPYRLFTLFTALVMVVSISLPSVLMAAHCNMDMQESMAKAWSGEHCQMMKNQDSQQAEAQCNWTITCDCQFEQLNITTEAVPSFTKTAKAFTSTVVQFLDAIPAKTSLLFSDLTVQRYSKAPPIFLLNSVFLN